jgi:hypothetical protein
LFESAGVALAPGLWVRACISEQEFSLRERPSFCVLSRKLPAKIQYEFRRREILFRRNPFDPLLRTHKLKSRSDWAFLVTYEIRVISTFQKDAFSFGNIGDHSIYRDK